jgi:hypothetical protein
MLLSKKEIYDLLKNLTNIQIESDIKKVTDLITNKDESHHPSFYQLNEQILKLCLIKELYKSINLKSSTSDVEIVNILFG